MERTVEVDAPLWTDTRHRDFWRGLAEAAWRHRIIHAVALSTLALSMLVGAVAGNMPDIGTVTEYGFYIVCAFWIGGCGAAIFYLAWLGLVEREQRPLKTFAGRTIRFFSDPVRWANAVNGIVAFIVFATGFSVLKGAITFFAPFSWDRALSHADKALHFGRAPYQWLLPLVETPLVTTTFNFAYNLWFVVLLGTVFTVCITNRDSKSRHRFLLSFMLLWLLAGFFVATMFSSAGPCYFERLGLGVDYKPLMNALGAANRSHQIWALSTQDMLWSGYTGARNGNLGISAFPSLHVATAVLIALYASSRSRLAGVFAWIFAAMIMTGSVVLAWHYAVDGYTGALISVLIWKGTGLFIERITPGDLPAR